MLLITYEHKESIGFEGDIVAMFGSRETSNALPELRFPTVHPKNHVKPLIELINTHCISGSLCGSGNVELDFYRYLYGFDKHRNNFPDLFLYVSKELPLLVKKYHRSGKAAYGDPETLHHVGLPHVIMCPPSDATTTHVGRAHSLFALAMFIFESAIPPQYFGDRFYQRHIVEELQRTVPSFINPIMDGVIGQIRARYLDSDKNKTLIAAWVKNPDTGWVKNPDTGWVKNPDTGKRIMARSRGVTIIILHVLSRLPLARAPGEPDSWRGRSIERVIDQLASDRMSSLKDDELYTLVE